MLGAQVAGVSGARQGYAAQARARAGGELAGDGLGFAFLVPLAAAAISAGATAYAAHRSGEAAEEQAAALVSRSHDATEIERQRITAELLVIDKRQRQTTGLMYLAFAGILAGFAVLT